MPRRARQVSSSGIYHIMIRGINRQSIFEDDEDREKFIDCLARYKAVSQYRIYAYCLMDNHVHLLLQETEEAIGTVLQRICSSYVRCYNAKHRRCGHLFQERFKSEVIENDSYFLTVLRYIHQNPIKAKMVSNIAEYSWSSYNEYIKRKKIVEKEYILEMFANEQNEAVRRFVKFSQEINEDNCLEIAEIKTSLSDEDIKNIIKQQFGIEAIEIRNEMREKQNDLLRILKDIYSLTVRQIARITGFSPTRVWRA